VATDDIESARRADQPVQPGMFTRTWRFRSWLFRVIVLTIVLTVASALAAVLNGSLFGLLAAACWGATGVMAFRLFRRMAVYTGEVPYAQQMRWVLYGLAPFLLGALFTVLEMRLSSH
jgi:drug/metabolite transporter (DMT)-like permease